MKALKIVDNLFWVGAVDWDVRDFHGHSYTVHRGTTYNAYLIIDEKICLIDSVYTPFSAELIEKIKSVVEPSKIDYIVANHVEVDHSGSISEILKLAPNAKVFCTQKGKEGFLSHYFENWNFHTVKTGDTLKLGKKTLTFIEAPMLHWPDSMFTYINEDAILLPNDAFGQHYATSGRFDDEVSESELMEEAQKYFANILTPFSSLILKKLEEIEKLNIPIKMICPSHGVIWRKSPSKIIKAYQSWASGEYRKKILIVYDTMWGSTEKMARYILEGANSICGVEVKLYKMPVSDRSDIMRELLNSRAIIIGSSTINKGILPTMAALLEDLEGLKFKNKLGAAFGSFGWSSGAVESIEERLKKSGIEVIFPPITAKWVPDEKKLTQCFEFGKKISEKVLG